MEKEIKNINWYNSSMWRASAILIISGFLLMVWKTMNDAIAIAILVGAMILISGFLQYIGMEKPAKDERIRKIGTHAATYSWYITVVFISFFLISSYWAGRERGSTEILEVTLLVMMTTMIGINAYLNWKGDVE